MIKHRIIKSKRPLHILSSNIKNITHVHALIPLTKEELRLAKNGKRAHLQIVNTKNIEPINEDKTKKEI